jgi:hypothetical protein
LMQRYLWLTYFGGNHELKNNCNEFNENLMESLLGVGNLFCKDVHF